MFFIVNRHIFMDIIWMEEYESYLKLSLKGRRKHQFNKKEKFFFLVFSFS